MSIIEQIDHDLIKALKAGEKDKVVVLRGLKSDLKYKKIEKKDDLTEDDAIAVLNSSAKRHKDSIEQFGNAGRDELVKAEQFGLDIIMAYLPEQLGEEEILAMVKAAIEETGAESPKQMGLVMKAVLPKLKGRADGKVVSGMVNKLLS